MVDLDKWLLGTFDLVLVLVVDLVMLWPSV